MGVSVIVQIVLVIVTCVALLMASAFCTLGMLRRARRQIDEASSRTAQGTAHKRTVAGRSYRASA